MSRTWKWILGILGALLLLGLIAGAVFMWQYHGTFWDERAYAGAAPGWRQSPGRPGMPYDQDGYRYYHMDRGFGHMPMMGAYTGPYALTRWGFGFALLAGLVRLVLPLGVLALVAYIFYGMGKRAGAAQAAPPQDKPAGRRATRG